MARHIPNLTMGLLQDLSHTNLMQRRSLGGGEQGFAESAEVSFVFTVHHVNLCACVVLLRRDLLLLLVSTEEEQLSAEATLLLVSLPFPREGSLPPPLTACLDLSL